MAFGYPGPVTATAAGLAPASGGGTANFLRADATWAVPPGTAAPGGLTTAVQYNNAGAFGGDAAHFSWNGDRATIVANNPGAGDPNTRYALRLVGDDSNSTGGLIVQKDATLGRLRMGMLFDGTAKDGAFIDAVNNSFANIALNLNPTAGRVAIGNPSIDLFTGIYDSTLLVQANRGNSTYAVEIINQNASQAGGFWQNASRDMELHLFSNAGGPLGTDAIRLRPGGISQLVTYLQGPDGTLTNPAYGFVNETNTGMRRNGAGTIEFDVLGVKKLDYAVTTAAAFTLSAPLTVTINSTTEPALPSGTIASFVGTGTSRILLETVGAGGNVTGRRANGSLAVPTALATDDIIQTISAFGYGATGYSSGGRAAVNLSAAQAWTDTAQGTYVTIATTPIGSTTNTTRIIVNDLVTTFSAAGDFTGPVRVSHGYTVATLPAGTVGQVAYVTDALAPTFLATVVGGGAVIAPVFYNGTNWVGG